MGDELDMFGLWPQPPGREDAGRLQRLAQRAVLELKSADALSPLDDYGRLLNDLTVEMREQFALFRKLRETADGLIDGGDEGAGKQARADAKAATEAMSLIVRTLEKVDSLQRQLARDRAEADERDMGGEDLEAIRQKFHETIEARALEKAAVIHARWQRDGVDADHAGLVAAAKAAEPGAAPGAGGP